VVFHPHYVTFFGLLGASLPDPHRFSAPGPPDSLPVSNQNPGSSPVTLCRAVVGLVRFPAKALKAGQLIVSAVTVERLLYSLQTYDMPDVIIRMLHVGRLRINRQSFVTDIRQ